MYGYLYETQAPCYYVRLIPSEYHRIRDKYEMKILDGSFMCKINHDRRNT